MDARERQSLIEILRINQELLEPYRPDRALDPVSLKLEHQHCLISDLLDRDAESRMQQGISVEQ